MTIRYSLTRAEIVRLFFVSLAESPRVLTIVLLFSLSSGALSFVSVFGAGRALTTRDWLVAIVWSITMFCFVIAMVFVRGKTEERTLSVSEHGISTQIGTIDAQLPWTKVKEVKDSGAYILIVGKTGNSFFVPSRAFHDREQRRQFLAQVTQWRLAA
jgi:hypothetical protein